MGHLQAAGGETDDLTTRSTYNDAFGNRTVIRDPLGRETRFTTTICIGST
ncbi:MAG: hypothetical protein WD648_08125 [Planctomycetaceae bacterium]